MLEWWKDGVGLSGFNLILISEKGPSRFSTQYSIYQKAYWELSNVL
jgi:hypothetical protein